MPNMNIATMLGRKPAKLGVGQVFGEMARQGGAYFGEMAVQKRNAEALEEARNYEESRVEEQREYNEEQDQMAYNRQMAQDAAQFAREEQASAGEIVRVINRPNAEGVVEQVGLNAAGEEVRVLGDNPDFVTGPDGTAQRLSAGGRGQTKLTERQGTYNLLGESMTMSLNNLKRIVGAGNGEDGTYDLTSWKAFGNQVLDTFGSYGNWLKSEDGKLYDNAVRRASEALFKTESGAAGSDAEAARYRGFFPQPGDSPAVVEQKMRILSATADRISQLGNPDSDPTEMGRFAMSVADSLAYDAGLQITAMGEASIEREAGPNGVVIDASNLDITQEDFQYIYE
jgi:hypothetical protein